MLKHSMTLLIALVMTSCGNREDGYSRFKVGEDWHECRGYAVESCGVSLWDCKGGFSGECLTNVE